MDWRPSQANGWWPKLSPSGRRLLYGNGCTWVMDFKLGLELQISPDGWHYGWLDDNTLLYAVGNQAPENTAKQHKVTFADDGTYTDVLTGVPDELCAGNTMDANDGHWATALGPRICIDGKVIPNTSGGGVKTAGGRVVWGCYFGQPGTDDPKMWGNRVYDTRDGTVADFIPMNPVNGCTISREGYIGLGYWGPAYLRWPDGHQADITVTPWRAEGAPLIVRDATGVDWAFTGTEDPFDHSTPILGHPLGDPTCLVLPDMPAVFMTVVCLGPHFRVACCGDRGQCRVQDIPVDAVRVLLVDRRPPMPQPRISFVLDPQGPTTAPCVFNAIISERENVATHRWQMNGMNCQPTPTKPNDTITYQYVIPAPGTVTFNVKAQGVPADEDHLPGSGGKVILAGEQFRVFVEKPPDPDPEPPPTFYPGVQTGFGQPLVTDQSNVFVDELVRGWLMARVTAASDPSLSETILREVWMAGLEPLVLTDEHSIYTLPVSPRLKVEYYNEPDIGCGSEWPKLTPQQYCEKVMQVWPFVQEREYDFFVGPVSNISPPALQWLKEVLACLPPEVAVSYHRYAQHDWDVASVPRDGYRSREDEFRSLKAVIGRRRFGCSEFGWKQDKFWQGWWIFGHWRSLTDKEIKDRIKQELGYLQAAGALFGVWYQIWEGDKDLFGLRHKDLSWKPQSDHPWL